MRADFTGTKGEINIAAVKFSSILENKGLLGDGRSWGVWLYT